MLKKYRSHLLLILIIIFGAALRFYGLNWDQGFHLHPDERQIILVTTRIDFSSLSDLNELLHEDSSLNSRFFAYGNFPIYFLKLSGNIAGIFDQAFSQYLAIYLVGRFISVAADLGIIVLIFLLGKKLFSEKVGLIAAFFYAVSVFPIQTAHFYAVDTLLTFFILATLYRLLTFYEHPTKLNAVTVGLLFGLSLATKTSALVLTASFGAVLALDFLLIFLRQPHRPHIWFPHLPKFFKRLVVDGIIIVAITIIAFITLEPYALIDFKEFWRQTLEQSRMTRDAFTFPYTLQYVGKIPYWYELKNIFLWGQGPILATLSFLGTLFITLRLIKHLGWWRGNDPDSSEVDKKWKQELILMTFFWTYFLVVSNFAIGFMRYLLPLYPLLCLFAAVLAYRLLSSRTRFGILLITLTAISLLIWPVMFLHIYTQPNTRVLASQWINKHIPPGKTLAVEHWDDGLPLFGQQNYRILTLPLYDPDTPSKWVMINQTLSGTDYIIIASNRLYTPLMKLTNCDKLPVGRCYKQTAQYYQELFAGNLGFKKVIEFSISPSLTIHDSLFTINDSSADESFTVYDHPKVMIFKKMVQ